jgi:uncharacterized RDD family membrane protein YckC
VPIVSLMNATAQASAAPTTGPKLDSRRVLAALVDVAIVAAGGMVILSAADALSSDSSQIQSALSAVILGWALYYYFALESGNGQTVGKRLLKLRVVRADGAPAGMREIAVRTVLRVVDGVGAYIVGLIVMLATGQRRQRLGDLAAGTIVVDASAGSYAPPASAAEPVAEAPVEDSPVEDAPVENQATITLPSRPAAPATLADLAATEAPPVPEMRPFDPPPAEPVVADEYEVVEDEPVAEFAAAPLEDAPVEDEVEASVEVIEEPVPVEAPQFGDEVVPVVEDEVEDVPAEDEEFTVRSVETVSAIDLVMGGAAEEDASSEPDQDLDEPTAS